MSEVKVTHALKTNKTKPFSVDGLDRTTAILIFNGKWYEDDNHQFALMQAFNEFGIESWTYDYVDNHIDEIATYTNQQTKINQMAALDIYGEEYLISHYLENLIKHFQLIHSYAMKHNLKIGYYQNFESDNCLLLDL